MPENTLTTPIKEAVCLHAQKIYDACRDRDCPEDLRVYFTRSGQAVIDGAVNVKCRDAELVWCGLDVERVAYNRGFYSVDVRYYYRITADAHTGAVRPSEVCGLAVYNKSVILFGSEGNAKTFSGTGGPGYLTSLPTAVVEAVDPVCLHIKLTDKQPDSAPFPELPEHISECFDGDLLLEGGERFVYCTLGQFSIVRLERGTQLVMPAYDFCMPEKECVGSSDDNPCDLFRSIKFPVDEFFPPAETD
jgi:hypothetical protein